MKLHHHLISEIIAILGSIFVEGRYADKAVEACFKTHIKWGARDRKLFAETVYDIVRGWRWYWRLAGLPDELCQEPDSISDLHLWHVWGAYWMSKTGAGIDFHECADLTLEDIRQRGKGKIPPAIRYSVPDWLYELGATQLGAAWPDILAALNQPADVYLRVNTLRLDAAGLVGQLAAENVESEVVPGLPDAVRLPQRRNVFTTQAFKQGLFEVQDGSSQKVAPFLEAAPGQRVIDACAGAGGKTLHLASLMQNKGQIIALDVHKWKLEELRRRARRNGAHNIEARPIEDRTTIKRLHGKADRVLLDVPCSGLGVLRRNPDAKWKLSTEEISRLQELQQSILVDYSRMVKPGGKLVYATCSILPSENQNQVSAFLQTQGENWKLEEELVLLPHQDGHDGFYAARLLRL